MKGERLVISYETLPLSLLAIPIWLRSFLVYKTRISVLSRDGLSTANAVGVYRRRNKMISRGGQGKYFYYAETGFYMPSKPNNKAAMAQQCVRNKRYPQNVLCVKQLACMPAFRQARTRRGTPRRAVDRTHRRVSSPLCVPVIRVRIKSEWRLNQVGTILTAVWLKCPAHIALSKRRRQRCAFNHKLLKMGAGRYRPHGWSTRFKRLPRFQCGIE